VRLIAATHVDLSQAVREGAFREDLFFRLNVVPILLPPLRERREDVEPLARHFLAHYSAEYGIPVPELSPPAMAALRAQAWPGNVRELRNLMERTLLLSGKTRLDAADVAPDRVPTPGAAGGRNIGGEISFPAPLAEMVRGLVARTLVFCGGNKSEAARQLRISRTRLQRLLDSDDDITSTPSPDTDTDDLISA
jgi:DNA-binding NtrC family response regulator